MVQKAENHKFVIRTILVMGLVLLLILYFAEFLSIVKNFYGVIFPLLLGAGIAYILNILVSGYEKLYFPKSSNRFIYRSRRSAGILLSLMTLGLILLFILRVVIPQVGESILLLSAAFPAIYNKTVAWAYQYAHEIPLIQEKLQGLNMDGSTVLKRGLELVGNWAWGTISVVGTFFGEIVNLVLAFIFALYLLLGKDDLKPKLEGFLAAYLNPGNRLKLYENLRIADETFSGYMVGQFKDAVILGLLCTVGMLVFGFPYPTVIGPVIGLTALVPMVGAYIGAAIGFMLIVMVDPFKGVLFLLFIIVLQQIEGNLIYPRIVGHSVGLPEIWVFAAITVGGGLLGVAGIFLGVPVAATVYKILGKAVKERLARSQGGHDSAAGE